MTPSTVVPQMICFEFHSSFNWANVGNAEIEMLWKWIVITITGVQFLSLHFVYIKGGIDLIQVVPRLQGKSKC